jgi:hypothetical protein
LKFNEFRLQDEKQSRSLAEPMAIGPELVARPTPQAYWPWRQANRDSAGDLAVAKNFKARY